MLRSYQTCHCHDWKTLALSKLQRIQEKLFQAVRIISCPVQPLKPDSLVASAKINARASVGQANEKTTKVQLCDNAMRVNVQPFRCQVWCRWRKRTKRNKSKRTAQLSWTVFFQQYIKDLRDNFSLDAVYCIFNTSINAFAKLGAPFICSLFKFSAEAVYKHAGYVHIFRHFQIWRGWLLIWDWQYVDFKRYYIVQFNQIPM